MTLRNTLAALCVSSLATGAALAAVSPEEAARLGKDLTPMGPKWPAMPMAASRPGIPRAPQYRQVLCPVRTTTSTPTPTRSPCTPSMPVTGRSTPTASPRAPGHVREIRRRRLQHACLPYHRGTIRPDWYYANTLKNATGATLVADGQKIEGNLPGCALPIPQSGLEVMWNHMIRYGEDFNMDYDVYYVGSNGKPVLSTTGSSTSVFPMFKNPDEPVGETPWTKLRINYEAPARRAGEILLVHEPGADYTEGKGRKAWQYLVGQRRVRLAPAVSFDTPNPGVAGTTTYDDSFIYNGSPERFDWTLVGKKEMIVPCQLRHDLSRQSRRHAGREVSQPRVIRWEKHRVWVVDSNLKEGSRHLYSRRTFYLDEDSWAAVAGEMYDGRGQLWRLQYTLRGNLYDRKSGFASAYGAYDLLQNIYNLNGKPIPGKFRNGVTQNEKYFTPKGLARGGVR